MGICNSSQLESESDHNPDRERERGKRRHEGQQRRGRHSQTKPESKKVHGKRRDSRDEGWDTDRGGPSRPSMSGALPADEQDIELQPIPSNTSPVPPTSEYPAEDKDKSTRKGKQKAVIGSRPPVSESGRSGSIRRHHHRSGRSRSRSASGQAESSVHRRGSRKGYSHHRDHLHSRTYTTGTRHRGRDEYPQANTSTTLLPGQSRALPPVPTEAIHDPIPSMLNHKTGPVVHPQADTDDDPIAGDPPTSYQQESRYPHIHTPTPVSSIGIALPPWLDMRTDSSEVSGK